jgi:hypothetical protein
MKAYQLALSAVVAAIVLSGCGEGGSSSEPVVEDVVQEAAQDVVVELQSGVFIDSAVKGLQYSCSPSNRTGVTNSSGIFTCNSGDLVSFFIAQNLIGSAMVQDIITPYTLFSNNQTAAINLAQLLQTLDRDGNPDNGIEIDDAKAANLLNHEIDFRSRNFDSELESYLGEVLVNETAARQHFEDTLAALNGEDGTELAEPEAESDDMPEEIEGDSPAPDEPAMEGDDMPEEAEADEPAASGVGTGFNPEWVGGVSIPDGIDFGVIVPLFIQANEFKTTEQSVSIDSSKEDMNATCQEEYGENSRLAKWSQIQELSLRGVDMQELILSLSMDVESSRALIHNDSELSFLNKAYILKYSDDYVGELDIDNGIELGSVSTFSIDPNDFVQIQPQVSIPDLGTPVVAAEVDLGSIYLGALARRSLLRYPVACYVPAD